MELFDILPIFVQEIENHSQLKAVPRAHVKVLAFLSKL